MYLIVFSFYWIVVELACGEYGNDKIKTMVESMDNGECIDWFSHPEKVQKLEALRQKYPIRQNSKENGSFETTNSFHQLQILLRRGWIKTKRDATLTHLRWVHGIAPYAHYRPVSTNNEKVLRLGDFFSFFFALLIDIFFFVVLFK